jgi:hypothetical protein
LRDINKRLPDCDDEGKRGKRGKRGPRGHDGATGPAGPSTGLLKFSGSVAVFGQLPGPGVSYLADPGVGLGGASVLLFPPSYPVSVAGSLRNLAVNIFGFVVPQNGTILVELLQNGVPVPGFAITYVQNETGIKTLAAGPTPYAVGSTFDLRVIVNVEASFAPTLDMSATIGLA